MKEFLIKNWKNIILGVLGIIFIYLLVRVFTPTPDMSEVNKYKLEQIDKHINEMKALQKSLGDSIQVYQHKIDKIDDKISHIKVEKKDVNVRFYAVDDKGTPKIHFYNGAKAVKGISIDDFI